MTQFNSPFLLGFDQLEQMLDSVARSGGDSYPPYNIEELAEGQLRIAVAVAGFCADDLTVTLENSQLMIRGSLTSKAAESDGGAEGAAEKSFIHRGIASRQFIRRFVLADGMEVADAFLLHGLLNVDLVRPEPSDVVQTIPIRTEA